MGGFGGGGTLGIAGDSGNFYLDSLVDPSRPPVRIPDLYSKNTAVHKTFLQGTLTPGGDGSAPDGNVWSVTLNPFVGIASDAFINDATVTTNVGNGTTIVANRYKDPDLTTFRTLYNEIRPVSAFMLITFVGDTLNDGGQVAAAYMPSGSMLTGVQIPQLAATGTTLFQYANLAIQPGAYVGPGRKGCFVRWSPEDERDSFFYNEATANAYNFPKLVASGITTNALPNIRWIVQVNYEYTSQSRLMTQIPSPIRLKLIEHAKRSLQAMPYACANDEHESIWSRFLGWAKGAWNTVSNWYDQDVKPILGPVLSGAGTVADAIGFPEIVGPLSAAGSYVSSHY